MTVKIYIVFYSTYGHVQKLAKAIEEGAKKVDGVEVHLFQAPETLPSDVLEKMHAPPKSDVPVIDRNQLPEADGILFGFPTRFGMMAAQMKALFDSTGGLWSSGALVGKTAGTFVSTATQNGGQETTHLTAITQLTHHGMVYVPIGYSTPLLFNMNELHGGSPYGASTFAGPDGSRQPSEIELNIARHQGEHFAKITKALALGKQQK
eukprot:TRINITY_DN227_c0_g1_i7.p1 TRINITY_DN227_c0_g1~~TRINITY_DN227_c0_g1_i7.p1  ORF type:complete len:207 (-),score=71.87 TRINITY_DN227_c0_g1_i7:131-751(-)